MKRKRYGLVILDIALPGVSGLEVLKEIKSRRPETPVLVLSMYPEKHYASRTLGLGASGYLEKTHISGEIVAAVRKVARGGKYITPSVADVAPNNKRLAHESLSPREYEVMRMIASGETVGGIAKKLFLSVKTIDTHRAHILEKLGLRNNVEIARYALEWRLFF